MASLRDTGGLAEERLSALHAHTGTVSSQIERYYGHQGTAWFNQTCLRSAGLSGAETTESFSSLGSVGAANIPVNLWYAARSGQLKRGNLVTTYGVGMGLSWSGSVMKWAF